MHHYLGKKDFQIQNFWKKQIKNNDLIFEVMTTLPELRQLQKYSSFERKKSKHKRVNCAFAIKIIRLLIILKVSTGIFTKIR